MKLPFKYSPWYTSKYVHLIAQETVTYNHPDTGRKRVIDAGSRLCSRTYCVLFTHPDEIRVVLSEAMLARTDFCPKCRKVLDAIVAKGTPPEQPQPR